MEDIVQRKEAIRQQMRTWRKMLSPEARERTSKAICGKLIHDTVGWIGVGSVAVYFASPDEIDLSDFIRDMLGNDVTVASPRWNGTTYELARVTGISPCDLRRGPMNILEPVAADIVHPSDIAVWTVPGLAFTKDGHRLGYGGGWYDRLLRTANSRSAKIGVAHEFQIVEELPNEPHDAMLNGIVTEATSYGILTPT